MAKAANDAIVDDCDNRQGCDQSLSAATFDLVWRLEAEIAATPAVTLEDFAIRFIVCDFEARDASQAALVREAHTIAGIEIAPSLAAALADPI